jgi:hypothetical protein
MPTTDLQSKRPRTTRPTHVKVASSNPKFNASNRWYILSQLNSLNKR